MRRLIDVNPAYAALDKFHQFYNDKITSHSKHRMLCSCFFSSGLSLTSGQKQLLIFFNQQLYLIHDEFHQAVEKSCQQKMPFLINQASKITHSLGELEARTKAAKQIVNLINQIFSHPELNNITDFHAFLVELKTELMLSHDVGLDYTSSVFCFHV